MRAAIARLRNGGEGGFTLPELLVALVIQGLIMGALAMAFIGIMRGSGQVSASLNKTGDARIAAQYIVSDARNSSGPELSRSDTSSCPDPNPPVAGTASPVVRFNWDSTDSDGDTVANTVNYVKVGTTLLRRQCVAGALQSDRAVASNVQSIDVGCLPEDDCSGTPSSIVITVTSTVDANGTAYSYTLTGTFRKAIGDGPPVNPKSVILLGTGGSCTSGTTGISASGSGTMRVYGDAFINTTDGSTCKAMSLSNSGVFKAGGTKFLSGGSCTASGGSTCPTSSTYSPAVTDPYASLTAPSTGGMTVRANSCSGGTALPGNYTTGFSLGGGSTCTLSSGVYVIQNGFSISNGATLNTGAGGVLIYVLSGQFAVSGGASITLTAMTSGSYSGLALWQAAANTNTISWSNGGTLVFNGAIYAPKAQLNISGNAQTPIVTALVVQYIILTNSGGVTVGAPSTTPLSITSTALDNWTVNRAGYDFTVVPDGGDGLYKWSASNLPTGLSIDAESGEITGTPTQLGTRSVSVTLSDQLGDEPVTKNLSITINAAPSISTTSPLTNGEVGASYSRTLAGSGGTTPYTWSATGLPAGLSISSGGVISGTPTSTGTSTVNATLTDASGATATKSLSLQVVSAVSITTASLPNGEKTLAYTSTTMAASGGQTSYTWSATGLPAGVSISSGGVISGTPTTSGSFTVNVTVTDSLGGTDTNSYPVTILPQPSISSVVLANKAGGTAGTIEAGDTVTITFSQTMKASTFCSAWTSGDASNYSITADNNVTVSVSNASPDTLTITSTSCTFNLGPIALGSSSYVSSAATFKGTGSNASTITWNASTKTMQVKLGAKTAGTTANVSSSAPTYTANSAIRDTGGAALSNSSYSLSSAKQF